MVTGTVGVMTDDEWIDVLATAAAAVRDELSAFQDLHAKGERPDQYAFDLAADARVLEILEPTGAGTFSEESGVRPGRTDELVVIDPVDGSTNASRHIPHYNTSLAVLDDDGVRVALVINQATGERFQAIRGRGATLDGQPLRVSDCRRLSDAIVIVNGLPERHLGWAQYRCNGAAALDVAYVGAARGDAFVDTVSQLGLWDYAAGHLIALEAGAVAAELDGLEPLHRDHDGRRGMVYAATPELLDELLTACRPERGRHD